jgi:site-specific recombinase XerD
VRAGAKGGKPRNVTIARRTLAAIDAYLDERAAWHGSVTDRSRLFVLHDDSPLTQQHRTLRRMAATAGLTPPEGAMAHALRHAYGMDLAMRGVPLSVIQQLLGHPLMSMCHNRRAIGANDVRVVRRTAALLL